MANVSSATSAAADIFASVGGVTESSKASAAADMESRFLTMLTTQLRNQDPLNPMDNAQMTSQLAQINTVNGIEKLNTTMGQLLSAYDNTQAMQAAGMIGKHVLTGGASLVLSQGASVAGVKLDGPADHVKLEIKDAAGKIVQSQDMGAHAAGNVTFQWDGKSDADVQLADGKYSFAVTATRGGEKVGATALQLGTVSAVTRSAKGFVLDLGDQGSVGFNDIQQIL